MHYERSRTYYAAGRYRASIVELETAIRMDPTGTNLYFDLGLLYERVGRIDRAMEAYRTYLVRTSDPAERERRVHFIQRSTQAVTRIPFTNLGDACSITMSPFLTPRPCSAVFGPFQSNVKPGPDAACRMKTPWAGKRTSNFRVVEPMAEQSLLGRHPKAKVFLCWCSGLLVELLALLNPAIDRCKSRHHEAAAAS